MDHGGYTYSGDGIILEENELGKQLLFRLLKIPIPNG